MTGGRRRERLVAGSGDRGERLDLFLARGLEGVSRKAVKRALDGGRVFVQGRAERRAGFILQGSETVEVTLDLPAPRPLAPDLEILFGDEHLLAVAKPPGLPAHPTVADRPNALDLVKARLAGEGRATVPVLLHRLDADTSGVLLFALTPEANRELARQFADREVEKVYLALVEGNPPDSFAVSNHLRPGVRGRTVVALSGGQPAETRFRTLGRGEGIALVEARPKTGRTHQIRVHLASRGYPILGDSRYGGPALVVFAGERRQVRRHLLHAFRLVFRHPVGGRSMVLEALPPADFLPFSSILQG